MLFELGDSVLGSGYRLSVNHRFALCLLRFKGFRSKNFITNLRNWASDQMLSTQTHVKSLKAGKRRISSFTQKFAHFPGISSHDCYSFVFLCLLQFKKFSSKIFIAQCTDLDFWEKCYQHKHTAYYWRPGKHTIPLSTQQFVFFGTFKPGLLMLIWLWALKYGRGTHHKNSQQIACHVSPQTYYVPRRPHWPCSRRKSRRRKWGAATIEAWSSRWYPATTHDSLPPDPYLLISTKANARLFSCVLVLKKITTKNLTKISTESRP